MWKEAETLDTQDGLARVRFQCEGREMLSPYDGIFIDAIDLAKPK